MNIQGFQKTTLLDYPRHVASTVFTGGCNFCCPFCHNGDLVLHPLKNHPFSEDEIFSHLKKRRKILDGVCITGGEPTLQPDLIPFLERVKDLGLSVKLDTNGYRPDVLQELFSRKLVDYVAMDIKGAPDSYGAVCGMEQLDFSRIAASAAFLMENRIPYEFRTTVVRELHCREDFISIGAWLFGAAAYYLQTYRESPQVISPVFSCYSKEELEGFRRILLKDIPQVEIRGVD